MRKYGRVPLKLPTTLGSFEAKKAKVLRQPASLIGPGRLRYSARIAAEKADMAEGPSRINRVASSAKVVEVLCNAGCRLSTRCRSSIHRPPVDAFRVPAEMPIALSWAPLHADIHVVRCCGRAHHREQRRHAIPIALAASHCPTARDFVPWRFGRRSLQRVVSLVIPATKNLHTSRHDHEKDAAFSFRGAGRVAISAAFRPLRKLCEDFGLSRRADLSKSPAGRSQSVADIMQWIHRRVARISPGTKALFGACAYRPSALVMELFCSMRRSSGGSSGTSG